MLFAKWNPYLRMPVASLLATVALLLPIFFHLADFRVTSEAEVILEGDQRNLESYEKVQEILKEETVLAVSIGPIDVFTPEGIELIGAVSEAFEQLPGVSDVKSLTHSVKPVRQGMAFRMVPFVPANPTREELQEIRQFSITHPLVRNIMVSADGEHTILLVTYKQRFQDPAAQQALQDQIDSTLQPFRDQGVAFHVIGMPLVETEIRSTLRRDIKMFIPVTLAVLVLVLWLAFRSWRLVLVTVVNQSLFLLMLPGLIELTGFRVNVFTVMLFPLLSGVHLTLLAHLLSAFEKFRQDGFAPDQAIENTLERVFKSCAFAAVTTGAGLLSLAVSEVRLVREFGLIGGMGVVLLFAMTFGPGLALLRLAYPRSRSLAIQQRPTEEPARGWAEPLVRLIERRRILILITATGVILATIAGIQQVRTDIRAVEFLGEASSTRQAIEALDTLYGGINVVQIELETGAKGGINQMGFLRFLEDLQRFAQSQPGVSGTYSYAQLLAMMNQIWEGEKAGSLKIPESPLLINIFLLALRTADYPFLTALSDREERTAHLIVRTQDMPSEAYLNTISRITTYAEQIKPPGVNVSAAKGIHSILEADRRILRSQLGSGCLTAVAIWLVLALLWRSPGLASVAVLVNALPVALVIALAGFASIPLNSITVMVAAITMGIAVDDSVHFITHWREQRKAGAPVTEAIRSSFQFKGRPIFFTSIILIVIFWVFHLSSFPPVVDFGTLSAFAIAGALGAVLFFLPAVLLVLFRERNGRWQPAQSSPPQAG